MANADRRSFCECAACKLLRESDEDSSRYPDGQQLADRNVEADPEGHLLRSYFGNRAKREINVQSTITGSCLGLLNLFHPAMNSGIAIPPAKNCQAPRKNRANCQG